MAGDSRTVALLSVLALGAVALLSATAADTRDDDMTGERLPPGPAREKRPGILDSLTPTARAAAVELDRLAQAAGLPALTWTSGRRTNLEQAAAMLGKVSRGENLFDLYKSAHETLNALFAAERTPAAWAAVLATRPPLSRHMVGEAVDVRRWGLTSGELYRLGELAIAAGWRRALLESDHLHLQL